MLKNKLKELKLIDYLFFAYIFFLPFIRIGLKVIRFTFSICDVILILIFLFYLHKILFQKFDYTKIHNISKIFFILYVIFFISISISVIGVSNMKEATGELLAYFYALIIILLFSFYIKERDRKGLQIIYWAFVSSLIIISLFSLFYLTKFPIKKLVYHNNYKYRFFTRKPNQLAIYIYICFCIYLISKFKTGNKIIDILLPVLLPVLTVIASLFTQSRTGLFVAVLLAIYFYIRNIKHIRKELLIIIIIIGLLFIFKNKHIFIRPLEVFKYIKSGEYIDPIRVEMFTQAIKAFKHNPVTGTGLGNFRTVWHINEIHNVFLAILAETGLIGFIPFCILFIWMLITIVFKLARQIFRKIDYIMVFLGSFIYSYQHYVLRERWIWVFLIYLVLYSYIESKHNETTIKS